MPAVVALGCGSADLLLLLHAEATMTAMRPMAAKHRPCFIGSPRVHVLTPV